MSDRNPKSLWEELLRAFRGFDDDDEGEHASDPTLLMHMIFTAPLLMAIFAMMKR